MDKNEPITLESLIEIFSKPRITPYLSVGDRPETVLDKYNRNIILSEAMHPTLHYLEICLRNGIDKAIRKHYREDWLINPPKQLIISEQDIKKIVEITGKIRKERKREPQHDDILAQMTFGFWCAFFHRKYDPILWHKKEALKVLFPNLSRANRKRAYIEEKILKIKKVRNRIAHQEPIWNHQVAIMEVYVMCHKLIRAMSEEANMMLNRIDRFVHIYQKTINP